MIKNVQQSKTAVSLNLEVNESLISILEMFTGKKDACIILVIKAKLVNYARTNPQYL